jgi:non-heme chloroperoxidase
VIDGAAEIAGWYRTLLQGLGRRETDPLQPWLAAQRGYVGRPDAVLRKPRFPCGCLRSSRLWAIEPTYDYDTFADDIAELVKHLELRDVALVGFSMGGGDIVRYIARHGSLRVSKLALVSAVTPLFGKTADHHGVDKAIFDGIKAGLIKDRPQFLDDFSPLFYGTNHGTKVSQGVFKQTLQIGLQASIKATIDCVTAFSETDFRPDMAKVDVPTLVVHGDDDQVVPLQYTGKLAAEMIKSAKLKVYPGAPHATASTHADQLNADLLEFVNS